MNSRVFFSHCLLSLVGIGTESSNSLLILLAIPFSQSWVSGVIGFCGFLSLICTCRSWSLGSIFSQVLGFGITGFPLLVSGSHYNYLVDRFYSIPSIVFTPDLLGTTGLVCWVS